MSENTGPAALSKIINDEHEFRTYMVLSMQEYKATMEAHRQEDKFQFDAIKSDIATLKSNVGSVSSSVGGMEATENQVKGAKRVAGWLGAAVIAILGALIWIGTMVIAMIEKVKTP